MHRDHQQRLTWRGIDNLDVLTLLERAEYAKLMKRQTKSDCRLADLFEEDDREGHALCILCNWEINWLRINNGIQQSALASRRRDAADATW